MTTEANISKSAAALGRKGGAARTDAKRAASAANGKRGGLAPKLRKDGTVTYWSVYRQTWVTSDNVPDEELAAMTDEQRARVIAHIGQ